MWFFAGFISLAVFCVASLLFRRDVSWRGEAREADGVAYEVRLSISKRKLDTVRVGVKCADGLSFTLTRERVHDAVSKHIGLIDECQTGDPAFDRTVFIRSDNPTVHRMLQTDRALREALMGLIEACPYALKSIEVHHGRLWIVAEPIAEAPEDAEDACARLAPLLKDVADRLEHAANGQGETHDPFPFRAACILAISTGLGIRGGLFLIASDPSPFPVLQNPHAPLILSIPIGLCVFAVLGLIALAWLGRSARTHLVMIELILVGLPGAMLTAYDEASRFNVDLDRSAPAMMEATVADLHVRRGNRPRRTEYRVALTGWPTATAQASLKVESLVYYRLQIGHTVAVEQHPGALGWPWVSGIRPH